VVTKVCIGTILPLPASSNYHDSLAYYISFFLIRSSAIKFERGLIPCRVENSFLRNRIQTISGAFPASYAMYTGASFLGVKVGRA